MNLSGKLKKTREYISGKSEIKPKIGLILGSGWNSFMDEIKPFVKIPYNKIPYFVSPKVEGHLGQLILCRIKDEKKGEEKSLCIMQGRPHFYEGYTMQEIVYPVIAMHNMGIKDLIITNASGAINKQFFCGDLVVIYDHINLMNSNPLIGFENKNVPFLNLDNAYDKKLIDLAKKSARELNVKLKEGIYVANQGPVYETAAEIKMLRKINGDLVGMSTVPEVIMAAHLKMRVLAIACVSNVLGKKVILHNDVIKNVEKAKKNASKLLKEILIKL